jgi:hypothetical protein
MVDDNNGALLWRGFQLSRAGATDQNVLFLSLLLSNLSICWKRLASRKLQFASSWTNISFRNFYHDRSSALFMGGLTDAVYRFLS